MLYVVTFSFDITEDLKSRYDSFLEKLKSIGKYQLITRTSLFLETSKLESNIRDTLTEELKRTGSNGTVLVIRVYNPSWALHTSSNSLFSYVKNKFEL